MKILPAELYLALESNCTLGDVISTPGGKPKTALYDDSTHKIEYQTTCRSCKKETGHEEGYIIREKKLVVETKCDCCKKKKVHEVVYDSKCELANV